MRHVSLCCLTFLAILSPAWLCKADENPRIVPVAKAWAKTSINAIIFRGSSITTHADTQYLAFYDEQARVVLAKRRLGETNWEIRKTRCTGNVRDPHNSISIAVDGSGVLHMSWDHHGNPLRYCQGVSPGCLELTDKMSMTGLREKKVTYPEFYNLPDGDLLFLYRDGGSGRGDTVLNRYDVRTRKWAVVQHPLIDGQGRRNAYTNGIAIDSNGLWHISWCWRETPDVATNHDVCYAKSPDAGKTWTKSTGAEYTLPITADSAECVWPIAQKSELINQCSMAVDSKGQPYIATYWRKPGEKIPQYYLVYCDAKKWKIAQVGQHKTPFTLSGRGAKYLPMCRPKVLLDSSDRVYVVFCDAERGNRVSIAVSKDKQRKIWQIKDLTAQSVAQWEPSCDITLWQRDNILHLFLQKVHQKEHGLLEDTPPQIVSVLEAKPQRSRK